ncbi:MAG: four helix bundle protein [Patescibacteria group bacterium]|nr:four helix bundle protein [Patescibacteria group bacterium]
MNLKSDSKNTFKQQFKKRCFDFSIEVLNLSEKLRAKRKNWNLLDQLVRSGTSIGANIVEGGNSVSKREFINYFQIAIKSASETLYWLALLKEINENDTNQIGKLIKECVEIKKIITTIILNTKNNSRL